MGADARLRLRRVSPPATAIRHHLGAVLLGPSTRRQDHRRLGDASAAWARAVRAAEVEAMVGHPTRNCSATPAKLPQLEAIDDVHAPASYRQHLAAVLSRRALEKALRAARRATHEGALGQIHG
jgi:CO/xanthine dehydrogenase FAD-binding subunit